MRAVLCPPLDDDDREAFEFFLVRSAFFALRLLGESIAAVVVQLALGGLGLMPDDGRVPDTGLVIFRICGEGRLDRIRVDHDLCRAATSIVVPSSRA